MNPEQKVIDIMKQCGVDTVLTMPCEKIKRMLPLIPMNFKEIPMTREENGVGIAAGLYLGGMRPAMVMQSTGLGNCINTLCSLQKTYAMPLPILVSWRGIYKEGIKAQEHFGKSLPGILDSIGVPYTVIESPDEVEKTKGVVDEAFKNNTPYVALFSPKTWEGSNAREFPVDVPAFERDYDIPCNTHVPKPSEVRFDMIKGIVPYLKGKVVVSNIGIPSKELYAAVDQPTNFYMTGSWGFASAIGLGLALSLDKEVVVIDGDGSLLMNPNALASISQEAPANLTTICFDNGAHGSTGNQRTFSTKMDIELLARAYGIKNTVKAAAAKELKEALENKEKGPRFIHALCLPKNADVPNIPLDPVDIKKRFMKATIGYRKKKIQVPVD